MSIIAQKFLNRHAKSNALILILNIKKTTHVTKIMKYYAHLKVQFLQILTCENYDNNCVIFINYFVPSKQLKRTEYWSNVL